eukprot:GHVR01158194.1.p1 GENE.GHVR01158194.1~~GHVR01158194.1.p1  ORF type:complete len:153 (-),score=0.91 GHVR01158194.1:61-519(-)
MLRHSPVYAYRCCLPYHSDRQERAAKADAEKNPASAILLARLAAQAELFDQGLVTAVIDLLDVVEKAATGRNELEQTAAGMVILAVFLEVLGEVGNALGQDGHLNFRRAGVVWSGCVFLNQSGLALSSDRHRIDPFKGGLGRPCRDVVQEGP